MAGVSIKIYTEHFKSAEPTHVLFGTLLSRIVVHRMVNLIHLFCNKGCHHQVILM